MRTSQTIWFGTGVVFLALVGAALPAWTQEQVDAHSAAALRFLQATRLDAQYEQALRLSVDTQIQANPGMAPFQDVLLEWATMHVGWNAVRADYIDIHKAAFTTEELNQLVAFYETPLGQKVVEQSPRLAQQGQQLGLRIGQEKAPLLQQMILERMQRSAPEAPQP